MEPARRRSTRRRHRPTRRTSRSSCPGVRPPRRRARRRAERRSCSPGRCVTRPAWCRSSGRSNQPGSATAPEPPTSRCPRASGTRSSSPVAASRCHDRYEPPGSGGRLVLGALRRRLRVPRRARPGPPVVMDALPRHRDDRRAKRVRQRAAAVGLRTRDRRGPVRRGDRCDHRADQAAARRALRRDVAAAAGTPTRRARRDARRAAHDQHHQLRPAGHAAGERAALRPHARGDDDSADAARGQPDRASRRLLRTHPRRPAHRCRPEPTPGARPGCPRRHRSTSAACPSRPARSLQRVPTCT